MSGLKVVFYESLYKKLNGISVSGAVFPFEYLLAYNLKKRTLVLAEDWTFKLLDNGLLVFQRQTSESVRVFFDRKVIISIKDLSKNKILFEF